MLRLYSSISVQKPYFSWRNGLLSKTSSLIQYNYNILKRSKSTHFNKIPLKSKGLYHPQNEKDSCGVGMVAHLKKKSSRGVVLKGKEMLERMSHRGAVGCDPDSGDGAGILVSIPHEFMSRVGKKLHDGTKKVDHLPSHLNYAVGNVFLTTELESIQFCKDYFNTVAKRLGMEILGWRQVPTNASSLGATSLSTEPHIEQVFVENTKCLSSEDFERELLLLRSMASKEMERQKKDFYVCSLSNRTITYKGQLTPEQLYPYFLDLQANDFSSYVALVHSRFSTNTFPSWDRAQPNRIMCHNGEINTLRGNKNWMYAREGTVKSPYFKERTHELLPVCSDHMSDSGNFDSTLEFLTKGSDRTLPEAMMMMIPQAWQSNQDQLSKDILAMYQYQSCMMEPWDGPAMMAFTDGDYLGATLDRNGLRPSRYYVTKDDHVILSSEVGVLPDLKEEEIQLKHRLEPGKMFLIDFDQGKIISDEQVKHNVAISRPFQQWVKDNLMNINDLNSNVSYIKRDHKQRMETTNSRLNLFGFTTETMDMLLMPMGVYGKEALGSMGNDAPLAVLSTHPKVIFEYFKQLFAQVTNPPIDPIREGLVMSLACPVGPEGNLLHPQERHAQRLMIEHPILSHKQMHVLKHADHKLWQSKVLDITFPAFTGPKALIHALEELCEQVTQVVNEEKIPILILSDELAGPTRFPIPSLIAAGAVHQHLIRSKQRTQVGLFLQAGDAKEVHDFCTLIGYGIDGIYPYMAYEALEKMNDDGLIEARCRKKFGSDELDEHYRQAVGKGILKVMSKMGISTLQSYKGAQVFEAVGLGEDIINLCFAGTQSRIKGADFNAIYMDMERFHEAAYPKHSTSIPLVRNPGNYHYRDHEEQHLNTPETMISLQQSTQQNNRLLFQQYTKLSDTQSKKITLRGLLKFKQGKQLSIPIEKVESIQSIVKRFNTGAMSLGSISQEAHETLAIAMNQMGARSNTGEGGEDNERFYDHRRSAIKQIASGRFGVTSNYLTNADQLQIKMAQGAKPGEGGELPGYKVSEYIGRMRYTTQGVGLISPPPHHDIYSIEDLAQLIYDLKNANQKAQISVKLVSEVGVGVIATGVSKAKADHITISGHDGGTGASSWTGVKNAGLPWELGLAETQQTLVLNDLRSRVKIQVDGQLKTARDVIIAALLGAEEYGFSTAPLITLGCIMMRKCHLNTCPVGIATQDEELRRKFQGKPEYVINFFWLLAQEIREIMAQLGFQNMNEMIGRADYLEMDPNALHYKSKGLDLSCLLINAQTFNPNACVYQKENQNHQLEDVLDQKIISYCKDSIENIDQPIQMNMEITNLNRSVGAMLSNEISKRYGEKGLPNDHLMINFTGHGGQSFGFALVKGVCFKVFGDCNDYVGKSLSGGKIIVTPCKTSNLKQQENIIVGNAVLYGGTSGKAFFCGGAGERFAVRNSGVETVVEGVGDHGCEYMTGGRVIILGKVGRNFAAGMSGGIAYVYDEKENSFPLNCNMEMVIIESLNNQLQEEKDYVYSLIQQHVDATDSIQGKKILKNWKKNQHHFIKVIPIEYQRIINKEKENLSFLSS